MVEENEATLGDALALVDDKICGSWLDVLVEHGVLTEDPEKFLQAQNAIAPLAATIDENLRLMVDRRREVEVPDPWRFGLLLAFLEETVVVGIEKDGKIHEVEVSRFQMFQYLEFWGDRGFPEWADEVTAVGRSTWMNWKRAARVYLLSDEGEGYLKRKELTRREFVDTVPIDKALRACAVVARGKLKSHQLDVLVDPDKSCELLRHALRTTGEEWKEFEREQREREKEWVDKGDGEGAMKVDFDPATRVLRLSRMVDGEWQQFTVARCPVPSDPVVGELQAHIIEAAEEKVKEWCDDDEQS